MNAIDTFKQLSAPLQAECRDCVHSNGVDDCIPYKQMKCANPNANQAYSAFEESIRGLKYKYKASYER